MNKVVIFSDSTCDLTNDIIDSKNVQIIPLYINFGEEYLKDLVDLTTPELYSKVEECGVLPKTAAPSPIDFIDGFKPFIEKGYDIVYVGVTSKLSATIQSATIAVNELDNGRIFIVDSENLSSGLGLLVLKACKYRDMGLSAEEIAFKVKNHVPNVKSSFVIKTYDYLHKGGRCSSMTSVVGTALRIKPIIKLIDGRMIVAHKPIGFKKALNIMINKIKRDLENLDTDCVMITHSIADDSAMYIKEKLSSFLDADIILETHAGCVISSHCGKGTIGILYIVNE